MAKNWSILLEFNEYLKIMWILLLFGGVLKCHNKTVDKIVRVFYTLTYFYLFSLLKRLAKI